MRPSLVFTLLSILICISHLSAVQLIGSITKVDLASIIDNLNYHVHSNKIERQYFSILGISSQKKLEKMDCDKVAKGNSIEETFYHLSLLRLLDCPLPNDNVDSGLATISNPKDLFFHIITMKKFNKPLDNKKALEMVKEYSQGSNNGSWLTYIFACFNELLSEKSELLAQKSSMDQLAKKFVKQDQFAFLESGIFNTALAFEYLETFCQKTATCIDEDLKIMIVNQLFSRRRSFDDVKGVIKSIQIIKKFAKANPKYLNAVAHLGSGGTFEKPIIVKKGEKKIKFHVSPLWMELELPKKVTLKTFKLKNRATKDEVAMSVNSANCKTETESLVCVLELGTDLPAPGTYMALLPLTLSPEKFSIHPKDGHFHIPVTIMGTFDYSKVTIREFEHSNMINEMSVAYPTENMFPLTLKENSKVTFTILVKEGSVKPRQMFVLLTGKSGDLETTTTLIANSVENNEYACSVSRNIINQELGQFEGELKVTFIAGGQGIEKASKWEFGSIIISKNYYGVKPYWNETWNDVSKTLTKSNAGSKTSIIHLKPIIFTKSELFHTFRQPEKRAHPFISNVFTCLVLGNFVILLLGWLIVGFNLSNMPCSLFTIAFHGGILGIFYLYYLYWTSLNIFTTMKYFSILSLVTFYSGFKTLRVLAEKRVD